MNVRFLLLGVTILLLQGCVHHNKMRQNVSGCDNIYKGTPYSLEALDQKNRCDMYNKESK